MRGRAVWAVLFVAGLIGGTACSDDGAADGRSTAPGSTAQDPSSTSVEADGAGSGVPADDHVFPGDEWESATPEEMGFDPAALESVAAQADEFDSSCFVVTRKGRLVGEWYWDGADATTPREVFSVTKSIASTLVGIAQSDGSLDIEDSAADYIDEWVGTESEAVTIRNLLSNDSGREWNFGLDYFELPGAPDRTQFGIDLGQQYAPGEAWSYNNAAIQTLDRVVSRATGEVTADFARERLLEPIGMRHSEMSPANEDGSSTFMFMGLQSTCRDLARFGYLFLRDGNWDGEEIVPAEWVEEATGAPSQEHNAAYGLLWWLNRRGTLLSPLQAVAPTGEPAEPVVGQIAPGAPDDLFTAQGLGGQIVMVDPGSETVAVRLGEGPAGDPTGGYKAPQISRVVTEALVDP